MMLDYKGEEMDQCFKLYSDYPCIVMRVEDGSLTKAHNKFFYENGWRDCLAMITNKQMDERDQVNELSYHGLKASL